MNNKLIKSIRFRLNILGSYFKIFPKWIELIRMVVKMGLVNSLSLLSYYSFSLGQSNSVKNGKPLDSKLNPLPWFTYPSIEFLKQLDLRDKVVFEFGAGMSSIWWSNISRKVISVEDNSKWYDNLHSKLNPNNELYLESSKETYTRKINDFNYPFDIIIIDGNYRLECAQEAINKLHHGGMIILDNSDWFGNTGLFLKKNGFKQIDFIGPGPINRYAWATSFFFKDGFDFNSFNKFQPKNIVWGINDNLD